MDGDSVRLIIVMAVLVCLSAFFSSAETAFSSLNKVKLKAMANNAKHAKKKLNGHFLFQKSMMLFVYNFNRQQHC